MHGPIQSLRIPCQARPGWVLRVSSALEEKGASVVEEAPGQVTLKGPPRGVEK